MIFPSSKTDWEILLSWILVTIVTSVSPGQNRTLLCSLKRVKINTGKNKVYFT